MSTSVNSNLFDFMTIIDSNVVVFVAVVVVVSDVALIYITANGKANKNNSRKCLKPKQQKKHS